ncbi:hypothetical protein DFH08DRAFT_941822 [Mycena albidolilacea]|uniref:Uncharacterized protein n=1 Tax=Mycena albidolilacea TaxID=1033008 RepID=A0AAD7EG32_9AGAR|nr:hypothetical protein DFH08DRAFT_941822 [Mycena albidolilacea]
MSYFRGPSVYILLLEEEEEQQRRLQRERERRERQERQERERRERERRERERERERRAQLLQQLKAPPGACPGGLSLNHLSSLLFLLVLSALALALVGWFIFLGLLLTILAYLLLVIMPESPQTVEPCSTPGVPGRDATFIRGIRSAGALAVFLPHVAVLAVNEHIHRVASLAKRCMDSGRNPAAYGFTRLFCTEFKSSQYVLFFSFASGRYICGPHTRFFHRVFISSRILMNDLPSSNSSQILKLGV